MSQNSLFTGFICKGGITIFLTLFNALDEVDKIVFRELFDMYKNYMYAIALSFTSNREDSEDIVQEVCIRLIKNLHKIKELESKRTRGFISIICRNVCLDKLKEGKQTVDIGDDWPFVDMEDSVAHMIMKNDLKTLLLKLKKEYLHIILLSYLYDYDDATIAKLLKITKDNVRKKRSRALEKLRGLTKEEDYEE